ncbi:MAG: 23S rRNA (guanosine(2251)-2'-O)-methyltransferase RlmB [Actinomycetota bacterium]|nr:23S rRNA (guanosine(2251)-2'-O)-methyltransferase RlmB [Actinomycetota bacterium]
MKPRKPAASGGPRGQRTSGTGKAKGGAAKGGAAGGARSGGTRGAGAPGGAPGEVGGVGGGSRPAGGKSGGTRSTGARSGTSRTASNRGVTGARQYASRGAGRTGKIGGPEERNRPVDKPLGGEQVEGRQAVRELLIAGKRRVHEVWVSVELDAEGNTNEIIGDIIEIAKTMRVTVTQVARRRLDDQARSEAPQGVLAFAAPLQETELATLLVRKGTKQPFLVAVDGVTDPGNLGALLRCCDGAGVQGVVLPRHRAVHVTPTVAKAAAGAVEHVPMAIVGGLPAALTRIKEAGIWVVGLDDSADRSLFELGDLAADAICLVLGAEGAGLSRLVRERCDMIVSIPMLGRLSSLNVSTAAALATYEIARHRVG